MTALAPLASTPVAPRTANQMAAMASPPPEPEEPRDHLYWSKAMALPAYTYGAAGATLSSLVSYAHSHPAGGIVIGPGGIHRLPDWTRDFEPGTTLGRLQPILGGVGAAVHLARGVAELVEAARSGENLGVIAGSLDILLAASSVASIANPGMGGTLGLTLLAGRAILDVHRTA